MTSGEKNTLSYVARALSEAPDVTPADLNENIESEQEEVTPTPYGPIIKETPFGGTPFNEKVTSPKSQSSSDISSFHTII